MKQEQEAVIRAMKNYMREKYCGIEQLPKNLKPLYLLAWLGLGLGLGFLLPNDL